MVLCISNGDKMKSGAGKFKCKHCGEQDASKFYFWIDKRSGGKRHRCKACALKKSNKWTNANRERSLARHRERRREQKLEVLQHYSESKEPYCACCKETIIEFLVLDHKHGGGNAHRKEVGANMVQFARANNYPPIFRVLCHNCNACLGSYGVCAHEHMQPK
jgi:hypothetical protein